MYKAFIRLKVRKVIAERDIPVERAIDFLKENPDYGVVEDDNGSELSLEELEHVKSFGSIARAGLDSRFTSDGPVSESTDFTVSESIGDNSESSTECDN